MPDFSNLLPPEEVLEETNLETEIEPIDEDQGVSEDGEDAAGDDASEARSEGHAGAATEEEGGAAEPKPLGDGKSIPQELKDLMTAHPDRAKLLKDLYFTNARYNKFGKVADLQKLKDTIDAFGSVEDAAALKERLDEVGDLDSLVQANREYSALDEKFTTGDPAYVDHIAKANPESFAKLAPTFLQRFGNDHPEQYNYLMSQVVMSTLINNGTLNGLSLLRQAAATGNIDQVRQVADQLEASFGAIQTLSQRAPVVRQTDPRVTQLEQEKQKFQQERQQIFIDDVKGQTAAWVSPEITKTLGAYGKSVTPSLARRLDVAVKDEIGQLLGQNAKFQSQVKAAISRGDRDGALRLYKQYVTPLLGSATRKVAAEFGLKSQAKKNQGQDNNRGQDNGQRQRPNGQQQQQRGDDGRYERVTRYPNVKEVNRDIPDYYKLAAEDKFLLKSGRRIHVVS